MRTAWRNFTPVRDRTIGQYLQEISRYEPLSPREESDMARRIRMGDRSALERLIKTNLRFVVSVARNYEHQGMALADLINEGNLGLMRAAKRFDEKKNFKFISYAVWWIRQAILQSLADHSRLLRIPLNRAAAIHKVSRARARLEQRYHRPPSADEVARELDMSTRDIERTLQIEVRHSSLDAPLGDSSGECLMSRVRDRTATHPEEHMNRVSLTREVLHLLGIVSPREQEVLRLYFGVCEDASFTLDEIGRKLDLTRERVRQIKENALLRLRRAARRGTIHRQYD